MSRERFVDPSIWVSEQICSVSVHARLLFVGIISTADDHGRRRGSAHTLRVDVFPTDTDITNDMVEAWRNELVKASLIRIFYDDAGSIVADIPKWTTHQHPRYVGKSKLPEYPGAGPVTICTESVQSCTESAEGRGVVGCGVEGYVQTPPLTHAVPVTTAPNGPIESTGSPNGAETDLTPTSEPANSITTAWMETEHYGKAQQLRMLMNHADHNNPVCLLAHIHEVDRCAAAKSKCAMLWKRLLPSKGQRLLPSDEAVAWATAELGRSSAIADCAVRGGSPRTAAEALNRAAEG